MTDADPVVAATATTERAAVWEDFIDIFYAPSKVFARRAMGSVWTPLLVVTLAMSALIYVNSGVLEPMMAKARAAEMEVRGISDHGFIHSIYFRDPDGYVVELTAKTAAPEPALQDAKHAAHAALERWQARKGS